MKKAIAVMILMTLLLPVHAQRPAMEEDVLERSKVSAAFVDQLSDLPMDISPSHTYRYDFADGTFVDSFSLYGDSLALAVHVGSVGEDIVAVQMFVDESADMQTLLEAGDPQRLAVALISAFCGVSLENAEETNNKVFPQNAEPVEDLRIYRNGCVVESGYMGNNSPTMSGFTLCLTAVNQTSFNDSDYWTPYSNDEYMYAAGTKAMSAGDYQAAILYFEQIGAYDELDQATRASVGESPATEPTNTQETALVEDQPLTVLHNINFDFIGSDYASFVKYHTYAGGRYMPNVVDQFRDHYVLPEFERRMTGSETCNSFSDVGYVYERAGTIIGLRRFVQPYKQNAFQILTQLGGSFALLIDTEPQITTDRNGYSWLKWEGNNGFFHIHGAQMKADPDWRLFRVHFYAAYQK